MKGLLKQIACQPFDDPLLVPVHQALMHTVDLSGHRTRFQTYGFPFRAGRKRDAGLPGQREWPENPDKSGRSPSPKKLGTIVLKAVGPDRLATGASDFGAAA